MPEPPTREYSDQAPVSKRRQLGAQLAPRRRRTARGRSASLATAAKSCRPLSACMKPLRMRSLGAKRVLEVVRRRPASRRARPRAAACGRSPSALRAARSSAVSARRTARARQRRQRRALRQPADPRRRARRRRRRGTPRRSRRRAGWRGASASSSSARRSASWSLGLPQRVGLAERPEPLDLQALAGVVLPDDPAARELTRAPGGEERRGRPPLAVALQRQEQRGQARRRRAGRRPRRPRRCRAPRSSCACR